MEEFKCPLCKQSVSEELFERITGIWKERRAAEKRFKEQEKELIKEKKEAKKQFEIEKKKLKADQKAIIEEKLAEKTRSYDIKLQRLENAKNKLKEQIDKKIALAIKSAERKAKKDISQELKNKMQESVNKEVKKATSKMQKDIIRANQSREAIMKQMSTLKGQNDKQQEKIKNLQTQLENQTTPQLEGLLYEDQLIEALIKEFPKDKFTHTGKGGDILQEIILEARVAGIIIYECKKVTHWQNSHVEQAFDAKLQRKADYAILVTNATKKDTKGFFVERGVIVVNPGGVLAIANILRDQIIRIAQLKLTQAQKDEAIEETLKYLQGAEFKNSLEAVIRHTIEMYDDLKKECYDHVKIWKKRHDSLKNVYTHTAQVRVRTTALVSGKSKVLEEVLDIQPFPALPDLTEF
jgi:hypothetical protein